MALSLLVRAHFEATRPRQPRKTPNEFELTTLPSETHLVPMPFPAAHPSRATSTTSSSASSTASTNTDSAYSVVASRRSNSPSSTSSRSTSSTSTDSVSPLSNTSAPAVAYTSTPKIKSMDVESKSYDLKVRNVFLPRTPVLRPLDYSVLDLAAMIPELRLDLIASTAMALPETPALQPLSDGDALKEIPDLDLDG